MTIVLYETPLDVVLDTSNVPTLVNAFIQIYNMQKHAYTGKIWKQGAFFME